MSLYSIDLLPPPINDRSTESVSYPLPLLHPRPKKGHHCSTARYLPRPSVRSILLFAPGHQLVVSLLIATYLAYDPNTGGVK